jgi:hypothetical protein
LQARKKESFKKTCVFAGENFDLQEKIEALNEQVKRLKRQHKLYLKKLAESGG